MKNFFKKASALTLAMILIFASVSVSSISSFALFGNSCGENVTWSFDDESGSLTISGTGAMDNYAVMYLPWYSIKDNIKSVVVSSGVTSICNMAFYDCASLTEVTVSDTVSNIGELAFAQSYALVKITVDENNTAYSSDSHGALYNKNKSALIQYPASSTYEAYTIHSGVTEIFTDAFRFNKNLANVNLPESLEIIGEEAFYGSALKSISIPSAVKSIGKNAFGHCYSLERIAVDSKNTEYSSDDNGVLFNSDKTQLIKYPNNAKALSYIIPDGVTVIEDEAFENCRNLQDLTIASSVIEIGKDAFFNNCFKSITVDSTNQNYSNDTYGALYSKDKSELISYPAGNDKTCYIVPDSTKKIAESAFHNAQSLEYIHISDSVTEIAENAINSENTYICSESESCCAKEYADANGIKFTVCCGHSINGIEISDSEISITNKETYQLSATVTPESAADKTVEWTSADTNVATVDENGVVTAISVGQTTITVKTADKLFSASCTVNVTPRNFKIIWSVDGNETEITVAEGEIITAPSAPSREGFTFVEWSPEIPETMPENDLYFEAVWSVNSYNAVFDANGGSWHDGSVTKTYSVKYGAKIYAPRDPSKPGYIFEGWTPEIGIMDTATNKEFTAVWSAATDTKYTVETYTMEIDGSYTKSAEIFTGTTDTTANAEYTVENGFELNEEKSVLSGNIAADGSLVLKIYYDRVKFTISLNGETIEYLYGSSIKEPVAPEVPEGHVHEGWIDEIGNKVTFPLIADENFPETIKPHFVRQSYTVVWVVDEAKAEESYLFEAEINTPDNPQKTGYTFIGWSPEIPDTMPSMPLEFTAVWTVNSYDAVFSANSGRWADGSTEKTVSTDFDAQITAPEVPEKAGYIFLGWAPEVGVMDDINGKKFNAVWSAATDTLYTVEIYTMKPDGTYSILTQTFTGTTDSTVYASYSVENGFVLNESKSVLSGKVKADDSLVLKAYIDRKSYTLTTVVDGVSTSKQILFGAEIALDVPVKEGYDFTGWDKSVPETMPAENVTLTAGFSKTIYTCTDCGNKFDDQGKYNEHLAYELAKKSIKISIKNNPENATINYGETLRLTAVLSAPLPEGTKICWYVDGVKKAEGETFEISFESGTKTVTVKITDTNGNPLKDAQSKEISDSQNVSVKSGIWQKIVSFFKNLFGMNRTIIQNIFKIK